MLAAVPLAAAAAGGGRPPAQPVGAGFAAALADGPQLPPSVLGDRVAAAATSCGVERWPVKTGTDADADSVDLRPVDITIPVLAARAAPAQLAPDRRAGPAERTVFRIQARLSAQKAETDSDYHLVLTDPAGHQMIAEIPDPSCVGGTSPFTEQITAARAAFDARHTARSTFTDLDEPVTVTGVGFFDREHGQTGAAGNEIELHPVLDLTYDEQPATTGGAPAVDRVAGANRNATAAAVSADTFSPGVPVAYVATGTGFPDALAGGAAAGAAGGPLLLTSGDTLPDVVATELDRLAPARIVVLGGPAAVPDQVANELAGHTTGPVQRVAGFDRYATAAALSAAAYPDGVPVAYVATGRSYPDALAGAALAARRTAPVLLVPGTGGVPDSVTTELDRLRPARIVVLGGVVAVDQSTADTLAAHTTGPVERIAGPDRYATADAVAQAAGDRAPRVLLATGLDYPDALAGGPAAAASGGVLLLAPGDCLTPGTAGQIDRLAPARVTLLGGPAALSSAVEDLTRCGQPDPGPNPSPSSGTLTCEASVDQPNPPQYSTVVVTTRTGVPAADVTATAHYKTTNTTHNAQAGDEGTADIAFYTARATAGYTVRVDVTARAGGQTATCATSFTPR